MPTPWDHLRAVLIAAHLAAITVAAIPSPQGELSEKRIRDPEVRKALDPWTALVIDLGLAEDEDEAVRWLFDLGHTLVKVRKTALGPSSTYLRYTGNAQSWRMFGVAPTKQALLEVHGRRADGTWEPLYVEHTEHNWGWLLLDHSRIRAFRSSFATRDMRGRYTMFARGVCRIALDEFPEYTAVRMQYQGIRIPAPDRLAADGFKRTGVFWPIQVERDRG